MGQKNTGKVLTKDQIDEYCREFDDIFSEAVAGVTGAHDLLRKAYADQCAELDRLRLRLKNTEDVIKEALEFCETGEYKSLHHAVWSFTEKEKTWSKKLKKSS